MPSACAASSASATSMAISSSRSVGTGLPVMMCFNVWPSRYSIAMKGMAVLVADFVDRADIGVIQCGGSARFAAKAFEGLRVFGYIVGKKLQRYEAAEFGVFGFVDDAHTPPPSLSITR